MPRYRLCALEDLVEGNSRGFPHPAANDEARDHRGLFAVRHGDRVFVYRNACPHQGLELNWMPDRFLTKDKAFIQCTAHGALFDIASGLCVSGPCNGQRLVAVPSDSVDGEVFVDLP